MRKVAITVALALAVLLPLGPWVPSPAAAAPPGRPGVERRLAALAERDGAPLRLPRRERGDRVWFAQSASAHRAGVAAVTWPAGQEPEAVFLREVTNGQAGPWQQVDLDEPDATDPGNGTGGTEPYVVAGAGTVEVAVVSAEPVAATLSVFSSPDASTTSTTTAPTTRVAAAAAAPGYAWDNPQIASRAAWGADESLVRYAYTYAQVTGAMIHHTAGSNSYTQADVPAILRSIQAYHVNGRGWNDIAYNILVDKFGKAWEGRGGGVDKAVQGGHAYGVTNARTTGISLIGNYQTATPSSAMLDTMERVIAWKFAIHKVDPYGTTYGSGGQDGGSTFLNAISGHRDENATDCPGQYVYSQMSTIRSKVASYLPQYRTGTAPVANAGADQSVPAGTTVTLDASASTAGSTFAWTQTAGASVSLSGATSARATFTPPSAGSYTFRVTVTSNGLSASDSVTVTATAPGTPGSSNVARATGVTVTASAQDTADGSLATKAIDGVVSGYPTDPTKEWTALGGGVNSWIELRFPSPVTVDRAVLYDRINANDQVLGGRISFSDGSTVSVGALSNTGTATPVSFPARTTSSLRFTVTAVSAATENIGLAEFEVWGAVAAAPPSTPPPSTPPPSTPPPSTPPPSTPPPSTPPPAPVESNLARTAGVRATATSEASGQGAAKVIDGSILGYPTDYSREWASVGGKAGTWVQLTFPGPVTLSRIVLYDRPNSNDRVTGGTLTFSDGSSVPVTALGNSGAATAFSFGQRTVTSVRLTVTSVASTTQNVGLAEFEAWGVAG